MTYDETIELEKNVRLKNEADEIYASFLRNIKLEPKTYKGGGRFLFWSDSHNETFITLKDDKFILECRFLHESYDITITPQSIFSALQKEYKGVDHLRAYVRYGR